MNTGQAISLGQLESHLWESANILRGPVDAADFKTYIFPLLFFKRICDVWDEEYDDIVDETGDEALAWFPESHRFQIPEDCHWNDVRAVATNVGTALQRAMREIEKANPDTLYGVFGDAQWTNKDRLSDALLKDLIEHFSRVSFGNQNITSDVLGDAYEYLIKKFADATNKKAGEFYTPRSVVRLMIEMLDPREGETIYDPACGTGGMLLAAVQHVKDRHGDVKRLWGRLYGQEKNLTTSSIARMNLFLHGIEDFQIVRGDTLRNPAFFEADRLAQFDCVIANPPFSLEKWGEEMWINDPFGRNFAGLPPSSSGDFAWVQHMVKSMAEGAGRMAVVLPQGALFRKGAEGSIRQKLLEMDLVEAVIGLAPNLFYGTGLAACILVLRKKKPAQRRKKVMIADASRLFRRGRAQNYLEPEHAQEIQGWFEKFDDVQDAVRIVSLDEINAEEWTLNISRYVLPPLQEDIPPLPVAIAAFKDALIRCREAENRLAQIMSEGGWLEAPATMVSLDGTEWEDLHVAGVSGEQIAHRIMRMVGVLHERGYQSLYLDPVMAPSGGAWRYQIGVMSAGTWPAPLKDILARGSITGGADQRLDWASPIDPPEVMADKFIAHYQSKLAQARVPCPDYVAWYREMLERTQPEGVLIFSCDGGPDYEFAYTWQQPEDFRMPMPPGFVRETVS